MAIHVIDEARRCLQCKKPLCRIKGCPVQTNVPEMIRLFLEGSINEAGAMLFENNPLSIICSLVCDHEKQCEGNCIQGRRGAPIQISSIEHYISNTYFDRVALERAPSTGQTVAVIGSGNSAMDVARTAIRKGCRYVTVYSRGDKVAASVREFEYAQADGVEFEFCKGVDSITKEGPLMRDRHFDEEGKLTGEGNPFLCPADSTVIAVSQDPKDKIVRTTTGIETNEKGLVEVDETGATTRPGVFSGGDVVLGPCNVVQVVNDAKHVAEAMDAYLREKRGEK